jgi:acetoin utilization deacetylase AcuC-like enzyme
MFPIAFHPIYQHPLPEGHRFNVEIWITSSTIITWRDSFRIQLFAPEICDLHPVLAIHKQEYVNDLIQLTLNPKRHGRLDFSFKRTYWTWIKNCTRNNNLCSKSFDTKVSLILQEGHHAYSTHGEAFVC